MFMIKNIVYAGIQYVSLWLILLLLHGGELYVQYFHWYLNI